MLIAGVAGLL